MAINTVIFDMDGLLINSEPIWQKATNKVFEKLDLKLTNEQYDKTTGLRTNEFLQHWFTFFRIDESLLQETEDEIVDLVIEEVKATKPLMAGVGYILDFFKNRGYKIGLATSSPPILIDAVLQTFSLQSYFEAIASANFCNYGKPNPEVYLYCANLLNVAACNCLCFEDSINGMIAAKAAKMKCVVVPYPHQAKDPRWSLANLQLSSLVNFNELHLQKLEQD